MANIVFKFAPAKALAAIHRMICDQPGIDLHTLLKSCYFADKDHLQQYGRPVFGATYRAMKFGPVPLEIYEMAKSESMWLAELGLEEFPWVLSGFRMSLRDPAQNQAPDVSVLSGTDVECLAAAHERASKMTFDQRTRATHGYDWQAAQLGTMRYEDMLHDVEDSEPLIATLQETSRFMRL